MKRESQMEEISLPPNNTKSLFVFISNYWGSCRIILKRRTAPFKRFKNLVLDPNPPFY